MAHGKQRLLEFVSREIVSLSEKVFQRLEMGSTDFDETCCRS